MVHKVQIMPIELKLSGCRTPWLMLGEPDPPAPAAELDGVPAATASWPVVRPEAGAATTTTEETLNCGLVKPEVSEIVEAPGPEGGFS